MSIDRRVSANGVLDAIVAAKRSAHQARVPRTLDSLWARVAEMPPVRPWVLRGPSLQFIAEFKRRSPSAGVIRAGADPAQIAREYESAGAAALSVLTDEEFFGGSSDDLRAARGAVALPVLRKDFLLDERDVLESRLLGADAALLIVRLLPDLANLVAIGRQAGLALLVEAHSDEEIDSALAAGADVIGVNHRDLDTLQIDLDLSARARVKVGPAIVLVAESGIATVEDMARMRQHGADAVLVGESLLRAPSPGQKLRELG